MGLIRAKQLAAELAGAGIARAASGILSVDPGTGLTVIGDEVLIDVGSTVTFGAGAVWSFAAAAGSLLAATPTAAAHVATKGYVDAATLGLQWREPADAGPDGYIGNFTIAGINALTPVTGMVVVATSAGTPTAGTSDALVIGSVAEFDGTSWQEIVAGVGGFVLAGTRLIVSISNVISAPLTDGVDDNKIVSFSGASNTPNLALGESTDGSAVLINGETGINENKAYVFDGTVPTGTWVQFSSGVAVTFSTFAPDTGGSIVADSASDTATFVGGSGIITTGTPASDTITWAVDLATSGAGTGGLEIVSAQIAVNPGLGIELTAAGVAADLAAAGAGTGGLAFVGNEIAVDPGLGIELLAGGVTVDLAAAGAGTGGLAFVGNEIAVDAGDGITLLAAGVSVLAANDSVSVAGAGIKAPVLNTTNKKEASAVAASATNDTTGVTIDATPAGDGMVHVFANGVEYNLTATKTNDFYFSGDGGTTARALAAVVSGDTLYLGTGLGFDLDASDQISLVFSQII
jgi:hypothetical protein